MIIAIDGPAASGKSVTAKKVADKLNFLHLNTGSMYRAVTLYFLENNIKLNQENIVLQALNKIKIEFNCNKIYLNKKNVSSDIRKQIVNTYVSEISANKLIRDRLVLQQREIASTNNIVIEGRDIGTIVFPNADYKFYLTADINVRAQRRFVENKTCNIKLDEILDELKVRDNRDKNRIHSPLIISDDAIKIDTTNLNIEEQVNKIINIINNER